MTLQGTITSNDAKRDKIQWKLDAITKRWWPYIPLFLLFLLRPYASRGYEPQDSLNVILEALMDPLMFKVPSLMPVAKAITILLVLSIFLWGNKVKRVFNIYVTLLYGAVACFQHASFTENYGLVIVTSNLVLILVVALLWAWEVFLGQNDFEPQERPIWKWWVAPLALLALLSPVDSTNLTPDFNPIHLLTNESGLTYCMMTPVILAVLTLHHPRVNLALLRVSSFAGTLFGVVNILIWFFVMPVGWWMGVLHLPLLTISLYAFILAQRGDKAGDSWEEI